MIDRSQLNPSTDRPVLGEMVRARRLELGWMQKDLAERSGIDRAVINRIESGSIASPAPAKLARLAEVLDMDLSELYAGAGLPDADQLLPAFQPYLRAKYGHLPLEAQERLAIHFARIEAEYGESGAGPDHGEDE